MPRRRHCAKSAPKCDFKGLRIGQLAAQGLNLNLQTRSNVHQQRVVGDLGLGRNEFVKLAFEGFDALWADARALRDPRGGTGRSDCGGSRRGGRRLSALSNLYWSRW